MKPTIQRILVPTDFSASSTRALEYAQALAHAVRASIHVLFVLHDPYVAQGGWELYVPQPREVMEKIHQDARTRLVDFVSRCSAPDVRITTEVRTGSPTDEINRAAITYGSDLIVMGTHGRTGLPHLLLGSIAERVLRTAPCPVLTVREALVEEPVQAIVAETVPCV